MPQVKLLENPGSTEEVVPLANQIITYANPKRVKGYTRRVKGKSVRVRGYSRNPDEYSNPMYPYQNPASSENPGLLDVGGLQDMFLKGSPATQDISVLDVGAGAVGFLVNSWAVKHLKLGEWGNILAAGVVPFITGAVASMAHEHFGSATFLGGQIDFASKLIGKLAGAQPIGLKPAGDGNWLLATPKAIGQVGVPGMAGANLLRNPGGFTPLREWPIQVVESKTVLQ